MTLLDLLIGFVGASATVLVVIGMVLIAPLGSVLVDAHRMDPEAAELSATRSAAPEPAAGSMALPA